MGVERENSSGVYRRSFGLTSAGARGAGRRGWTTGETGGHTEIEGRFRIEHKYFALTLSPRKMIQICEILPWRSYRIWVDSESLLKIRACLIGFLLNPTKIGWAQNWDSGNRSFSVTRKLNNAGAFVVISEIRKDGTTRIFLPEGENGFGLRLFCSKITEVSSNLFMSYQFQFTEDLCYSFEPSSKGDQRFWMPTCCLANRSDIEKPKLVSPSAYILLDDLQRQGFLDLPHSDSTSVGDSIGERVTIREPTEVQNFEETVEPSVEGRFVPAGDPVQENVEGDSDPAEAHAEQMAEGGDEPAAQAPGQTTMIVQSVAPSFEKDADAFNKKKEHKDAGPTVNAKMVECSAEFAAVQTQGKGGVSAQVVEQKEDKEEIEVVEDASRREGNNQFQQEGTSGEIAVSQDEYERIPKVVFHEIPGFKGGSKFSATVYRVDGTQFHTDSSDSQDSKMLSSTIMEGWKEYANQSGKTGKKNHKQKRKKK